jgi:hypothetical protein
MMDDYKTRNIVVGIVKLRDELKLPFVRADIIKSGVHIFDNVNQAVEHAVRYFNKEELEDLLFNLGIDQDELPNATKPELAKEIILYCERHDRLERLLEICRDQRPHAEWPEEL